MANVVDDAIRETPPFADEDDFVDYGDPFWDEDDECCYYDEESYFKSFLIFWAIVIGAVIAITSVIAVKKAK
ncbi:MAG: hypothetical protein MJ154_03105 [Candidatus Saccharibacteria bacterium]|nr:hypothetical protein [Candidatus Saccharibacteria bacterium]